MNDLLQSGHHPDADQLNAFVEHALPPHEYEQTLAHLAACPDCRSVVALSMPPIEEVPTSQAEVIRKPWFSGWKLAWPTAAAIAALAIVVIYIRNTTTPRSTAVSTQRADSHLPAPVPAPETLPTPEAGPGSVSDRRPASSSKAKGSIGLSSRNATALSNQNGDLRAPTQPSPLSATTVINGRNFDPLIAGAAGGSAASGVPPASPLASPAAVGGPLRQSQGVAPPPRTNDEATMNAFNQSAEVTTATAPATLVFNSGLSGQPGGVSAQLPLPSHLPVISMASAAHQILAIDTQNTLFFSGDGGKSWKVIPPLWQGRAMKVALASSATLTNRNSKIGDSNAAPTRTFAPQASPVHTQPAIASSTLTGKVTDATGAAIPDAAVVVTSTETKNSRTVKTDHSGSYLISDLVPGHYQVAARAPGFVEQVSAVSVAASAQDLANFVLPIGSAAQTVTVEATAMPIASVDSPVSTKKIAELPAAKATLPLFEITTAEGDHWVSADGQTWKHK